ncbi:MAG: hypothetical protein COU90_02575 [Candidatus Ryanbacteria bacterium CG10_big_fil_rev_8_21_14_0_10_43_42]|uniref:Metal ABC transporter permease n=1 Tax=Candidatus Ryanbacteria bacterium CG10_big_fil_rev_8_21_14_0_10_43_42 TaxID=1974864 RepID=A0A2M8KWP1_9BACT|nr:MAG: hypothetical protein COU90_02575 [Candidatus Ryanbacteria bacterium CG10_big_fil_rev_8_21_14_0_10_43_42]
MEKEKSHLLKIIPYLLAYKWRVVFSLMLIVAGRVFSVANPYVIKKLIDMLVDGALPNLSFIIGLIILFFIFRWGTDITGGIKDYIFAKVEVGVKRRIPLDVFEHLLSLPLDFHADQATGGVARKIARGTNSLSSLSFFFTGNILPTIIEILFILGIFLFTFPISFSIVFAVFVAVYIVYTVRITDRRQVLLIEANKRDDAGSEKSVDALLNFETVKYFTNEEFEIRRYDTALGKWAEVAVESTKKGANLNMGQGFIITAGLTVLLALATREFMQGAATIGDFVLITSYLNRIAIPMSFLGALYRRIKEGLADIDAMFRLFDTENTITDKIDAHPLIINEGRVEFRDVVFGYNTNRKILRGISIDMPAKKSIALVGYSGSGKSTISKLLLRLYDVLEGGIYIDGVDIRDVTQKSLREAVGVVAQDTILFNDTIGNNIAYGRPDATEEEIQSAAKIAHIHEFIETLPEQYNTRVGERGVKLSGGEKQRVAIARMLLKDPPILLFDEATASLDSKSERLIQDSIAALSHEGRTTIVIAHRLSTIVDFDKIVVMADGAVIEQGTHKELLQECGAYQRLWSTQNKHL